MTETVATLHRRVDALAWLLRGARDPELIIKLRNELAEVRIALHRAQALPAES